VLTFSGYPGKRPLNEYSCCCCCCWYVFFINGLHQTQSTYSVHRKIIYNTTLIRTLVWNNIGWARICTFLSTKDLDLGWCQCGGCKEMVMGNKRHIPLLSSHNYWNKGEPTWSTWQAFLSQQWVYPLPVLIKHTAEDRFVWLTNDHLPFPVRIMKNQLDISIEAQTLKLEACRGTGRVHTNFRGCGNKDEVERHDSNWSTGGGGRTLLSCQ